jgi:hypothetical protein
MCKMTRREFMLESTGNALQVAALVLIVWWGSHLFPAPESRDSVAEGTDMFWELHDRHFPTHYLQDGRVICTEEQAAKELEKLGWRIER